VTQVLDGMTGLREEELEHLAPYFDVAKIGGGLPLLLARERLKKRIALYHRFEIGVSTGGELLEYAARRGRVAQFLDEARAIGFDLIEVAVGARHRPGTEPSQLCRAIGRRGLRVVLRVGETDPGKQLSLAETIAQVARSRALEPERVGIAASASGAGAGIYDAAGAIRWEWVRAIVAQHPPESLLFEAPLESQQVQLLRGLGPDVNLGHVAIAAVAPLATDRLGLRGEPFGPPSQTVRVGGPPAAKFLYYLLDSHRGLDQDQLAELSRLPRRTVQSALQNLRRQRLIEESISLGDSRRRLYRLAGRPG
jgi:phosphosulfolactate synthase